MLMESLVRGEREGAMGGHGEQAIERCPVGGAEQVSAGGGAYPAATLKRVWHRHRANSTAMV